MTKVRDAKYLTAFGERLRYLRKSKNLSQEQLHFDSGIPLSQIGRLERGEVNTTISTVLSLSQALDIHPRELMDFQIDT